MLTSAQIAMDVVITLVRTVQAASIVPVDLVINWDQMEPLVLVSKDKYSENHKKRLQPIQLGSLPNVWFAKDNTYGLFTVGDRDRDLFWIQCRLIGAFTVSVCISDCDSDVAITKFQMGVAPI